MLRLQQKFIRYCLINPKIRHTAQSLRRDNLSSFYPVVGLTETKLGTISLNKPNNANLLTSQCIDQLYRFLLSYQSDHSIQNVWVQHRGYIFSGGCDFKQLKNDPNYLDRLHHFFILAAKFNKPIIAKVDGSVKGIAGYLLSMLTVGLGTNESSLKFDETGRGMIPICGGSHRLNQLPFSIGTYLALTGRKLDQSQMGRLGFLNGMVNEDQNSKIRKKISQANLFFRQPLQYHRFDQYQNQAQQKLEILNKKDKVLLQNKFEQFQILRSFRNIHSKLAQNHYKLKMIDYANTINPFNSFSQPQAHINNYYSMRIEKPMTNLWINKLYSPAEYEPTSLFQFPICDIDRIFSKKSLKEVMSELQKTKGEWAQETIKSIKKNDPLALLLTFELLKRAKNLSWDGCLDLEYGISRRLINQSELKLSQNSNSSQYILSNKYSKETLEKLLEAMTNQELESYFNTKNKMNHQLKKYSLVPSVDYYHIPDSARTYLNRVFFEDVHYNNQQIQIKRYLGSLEVDYRSKNFDVDTLRKKIYEDEQLKKDIEKQSSRIKYLIFNQNLKNDYKSKREKQIDRQFSSKKINHKVQKIVSKLFKKKLQERFQSLNQTVQIAAKEAKIQIFRRIKASLVKNVILKGDQIQAKRFLQYPRYQGLIEFDSSGKGPFSFQNTIIKQNKKLKAIQEELKKQTGSSIKLSQRLKNQKQVIKSNVGIQKIINQMEVKQNELSDKLYHKYGYDARLKEKVKVYQQLIKIAAKTQSQLKRLRQLTKDKLQLILKSPQQKQTYGQFAKKIEQNINTQKRIEQIQAKQLQDLVNKIPSDISKNEVTKQFNARQKNGLYLVEQFLIETPFQARFLPILKEVISQFQHKYRLKQKQFIQEKQLGIIDEYFNASAALDYTQFMRADIEFIFSYLVIIQMREIMISIQQIGGISRCKPSIQQYFKDKHNIHFSQKQLIPINKQFMKFFYRNLDIHARSKHHILMPQTKLLDYIIRLKIRAEMKRSKYMNSSFQSWVLLIAKDRSKILEKQQGSHKKFGLEPQYAMGLLNQDMPEKFNFLFDQFEYPYFNKMNQIVAYDSWQKKKQDTKQNSLLTSYYYYIYQYDRILAKVSGPQNFLNEKLRKNPLQDTLQILKKGINFNQSAKKWVQQTLESYIGAVFQYRQLVEKQMTKGELIMFDRQINELLSPEELKNALKTLLSMELNRFQSQFSNKLAFENTQINTSQILYLTLMKRVKNFKALTMFNNFMKLKAMRKDYKNTKQEQVINYKVKDIKFWQTLAEEKQKLQQDKNQFEIPKASEKRMMKDIFSYPKPERPFSKSQNIVFNSDKKDQRQQFSPFFKELSDLKNVFQDHEIAKQLQNVVWKIIKNQQKN